MTVIDCHGRAYIAAYYRAQQEYRQLIYAANNAVNLIVDDVRDFELPGLVHYPAGADVEDINRRHMMLFASGAKEAVDAVRRAKRALLDVLGYIDEVDIPQYSAAEAQSCDYRALDCKRAAFFANALEVNKMFSAQRFDPELCARTLAAADALILAVDATAKKWIPDDVSEPVELPEDWTESEKLPY